MGKHEKLMRPWGKRFTVESCMQTLFFQLLWVIEEKFLIFLTSQLGNFPEILPSREIAKFSDKLETIHAFSQQISSQENSRSF